MNYPLIIFLAVVIVAIVLVIVFAKKYTFSVTEFKNLFSGMHDGMLINVEAVGPRQILLKYKMYPIDSVRCYDKKGNMVMLKNKPGLEIQFTSQQSGKTSIYFDTIRINGDIVTGSPSRYIGGIQKTIDLRTVESIELRNIKRAFKYKNNPFG